ncbi:MAG: Fic family protein [Proteobacteria bacterium]|nr:Fic family protein [Desulfobacteraceae bacterium]MBU3981514.1 Fic family protein [Pseudomonadota bacterium]MBU4012810.1 Fic family protein [Pseudomonadota bacterium]MBU4068249.1 Fic family protein [Pseudomonadota bacterium]MBU4101425.1 Fic family protein [Pseudomonadota bacterium]
MRTYEKTHPWLTFQIDLRLIEYETWIALGEAQSKCEHISGVPLRPAVAKQLHIVYLAKGVLATTAIEGNTLTESEVIKHLEGKLKLPPSKEYLSKEIDNIIAACEKIATDILIRDKAEISVEKIKNYNKFVLDGMSLDESIVPGQVRTYSVGVGGYRAAPAEDCEYLLQKLCSWLNEFQIPENNRITFGILKAIIAHIYFAWIHPFGDGNGRTARLIEFQILLEAGIPTPAAHLLSNFYNQTRAGYYRQLDKTTQMKGDISDFIKYASTGFVDQLKEQLNIIRLQQWDIVWRNYVHEMFKDQTSEAAVRQRRLALDLSFITDETIRISKIPEISTRMAAAYAKKTRKTMIRDVNKLISMGLMEQTKEGVRAKREVILAFLPARKFN